MPGDLYGNTGEAGKPRRSFLVVILVVLLAGCGGSSESEKAQETYPNPAPPASPSIPPPPPKARPPVPERVEGLAVGESTELASGSTTVTIDAAYKVTPREGDFTPSKGGPNWSFFGDLQKEGEPALLLAVTVAIEEGANASPQFSPMSFIVQDANGYTMPSVANPPELDPQHPSSGWQGLVPAGQTQSATIAYRVPPEQAKGLSATYQFSVDPRDPRAVWELGDFQALPEAPVA